MSFRPRRLVMLVIASLAALAVLAPAAAKDGDVLVRGTCTGPNSSKLKLSEEDGRIEVEFEVDQNRNGVRWSIVLRRPAAVVARATAVTRGPSGSFELRRVVGNQAGDDRITARATRASGEVCRATAIATF